MKHYWRKNGHKRMKIATYNIWNSDRGYPGRIGHIVDTLKSIDADIIGLQEVNETAWKAISRAFPNYEKRHFLYRGDDEGLAVISKYPIIKAEFLNGHNEYPTDALVVTAIVHSVKIDFATFHLTWNSEQKRISEITNLEGYLKTQYQSGRIQFALGDMNCDEKSAAYKYFCEETVPAWRDLVREYGDIKPEFDKEYSLDFENNPRWRDEPRTDKSFFADRVFVRSERDTVRLMGGFMFGKETYPETGLSPSDHYGVCFEVEL